MKHVTITCVATCDGKKHMCPLCVFMIVVLLRVVNCQGHVDYNTHLPGLELCLLGFQVWHPES